MKCFGFSCAEGLSIELCQETITVHPDKELGIQIVGNIIVRSHSDAPKQLGIWHRGNIEYDLADTPLWLNRDDLNTHLFFNLVPKRGSINEDLTINTRLYDVTEDGDTYLLGEDKVTRNITVPYLLDNGGDLNISYPLSEALEMEHLIPPDPSFTPYVYAEIGPFCGQDKLYAIRVKTEVEGVTYNKLVEDNPNMKTRFYQIYGADEILDKIGRLDLPEVSRNCDERIYKLYRNHYKSHLQSKKLIPDFYSVIVVDLPSCTYSGRSRICPLPINGDMKDITDTMCSDLFDKEELKALKGRIFWFVSKKKNGKFMLWIEGPTQQALVK